MTRKSVCNKKCFLKEVKRISWKINMSKVNKLAARIKTNILTSYKQYLC